MTELHRLLALVDQRDETKTRHKIVIEAESGHATLKAVTKNGDQIGMAYSRPVEEIDECAKELIDDLARSTLR